MKDLYKEKFLWIDLLAVVIIDVLLWAAFKFWEVDLSKSITVDTATSLFSSLIGTWGAMLGFIITGLSILLGIKENDYIKALKGTPHFNNICYIYLDTSIWLGAATVFSIAALILINKLTLILAIGSFIFPVCIARIARCLQFLKRLIALSNK